MWDRIRKECYMNRVTQFFLISLSTSILASGIRTCVSGLRRNQAEFSQVYDPCADLDANGYVLMPNVSLVEAD